jgi:long-chain acyl-CoA synthetase
MAAMEMPLVEGYGLTEAGPAVTGSTLEDRRIGSVGRPLPGAEIRIGPSAELLIKSPGVMLGYWQNPEATQKTFDSDGWLRTGDTAEIIDGRVFIRGRLKDIIVLSTGENVNPAPIEAALIEDPLVEQASVVGDGRPRCAAVVVVDPEAFKAWSAAMGIPAENLTGPRARAALTERLLTRMEGIPPFARICSVLIETRPWTLESGLVTPTLKSKRKKVFEKYEDEFAVLFEEVEEPSVGK